MSDTWQWGDLAAALTAIPDLHGARCKGNWEVFDDTDHPEIVEYALHQCANCPRWRHAGNGSHACGRLSVLEASSRDSCTKGRNHLRRQHES